jgi:hypothetical protein
MVRGDVVADPGEVMRMTRDERLPGPSRNKISTTLLDDNVTPELWGILGALGSNRVPHASGWSYPAIDKCRRAQWAELLNAWR